MPVVVVAVIGHSGQVDDMQHACNWQLQQTYSNCKNKSFDRARIKTECQQRHFKTFLVNGALVTNASCAIVPQLMSPIVVAKGEETGIVMEIAGRLLRAALSGATSCCDLCCGCCCFVLFVFFFLLS